MGIVFSIQFFQVLDFLDEAVAHVGGKVEIECRDGLSAVHLVLGCFQRDASQDTGSLDAFGRARFAVSGREAVFQNMVQRMLHACQALGGIIILVMDVQIVLGDGIQHFFTQQIVVHKRLGGFAGKLHHHARRGIGIHVGIFACDVVGLDVDNFQEHVARLCFAGNASLVAVSDVFLGNVLAAALHQLHFHQILDGFHRHLRISLERDAVRNLVYQLQVFPLVCMQHGFADGRCYFFFVESDDAPVALEYCLYHNLLCLNVTVFFSLIAETKIL